MNVTNVTTPEAGDKIYHGEANIKEGQDKINLGEGKVEEAQ